VPIVQNGKTVQTTTGAIAASPSQLQTFLTLNQEPTLPNSRALSGSTGITLVDGGALSTLQIVLNGASGSLETSNNGIIAKTSGTTVTGRTITASGVGLTVTNGNGVSGNPTIALSGLAQSIANLSGTGIVGIVGGSSYTSMVITGTANQIDVANGAGPGNPTISITSNPSIPGTGAMIVPVGTNAQRPGGTNGQIRYNSDTGNFEVYSGGWVDLSTSAGALDFYHNGSLVASGDGLNFIDSSNIDLTVVDDPFNGWVAVTPQLTTTGAVAGAYGSQTQTLTATVDSYGRLSALAATNIGNLPNSALQNSSVTYNGVTVALGASGTITAATPSAVTFNDSGSGAASGTSFDGSVARTVSYNTIGAPSTSGTNATGTWNISISGNAATATTSTNVAGGAQGSLIYQSAASTTQTLPLGTLGDFLVAGATAPQWSAPSGLSIGTATNLAGGAAGSIPYQTGAGVTAFLAQSSGVLVGGVTPSYSTAPTLTGTNFSSIPNGALQNSSFTIGSTSVSLGGSTSTLAGLTSVTVTQPPSAALQLATKQYVDDQVSTGIDIHTPVRVETPTALTATYTPGGTAVTVTDITGSKTLTFSTSPSLSVNDQIVFSVTSNGIVSGTAYYVYSVPAANQVTLSLSYNGPEITTLTDGTGLTITGTVNAGVGATLTNAGANAAIQIDGVTLSATNRVLVYNQANAFENGVYTVTTVGTPDPGGTPWVLTRSTDTDRYRPDSTVGLGQGDYFFVQEGLTGAGESYVLTTNNPLIIGTTNLTFTQFSSSQVYSAGTGLTLTGTTFSLTNPVVTTLGGTGLATYTTGDILYYSAGTALSKLGIGASTYLMTSSGTAPQWTDPASVTVGTATTATTATSATTATNVAGGSAGAIVYQTGAGATTTLALGTAGYFLTAGASAPQYSDPTGLTVGNATNAVTATNANNVAVSASSVNATFYPTFVDATTGNQSVEVDTDLTYNPSTNTLTAGTVVATTGIFGGTF
jgi:hypothetical protein